MRPPSPRKLLVASVGVATVSYVLTACDKPPVTGNLPAPPPPPSIPIVGNLPAPPPPDAGAPPAPTAPAPDAGQAQTPKGK